MRDPRFRDPGDWEDLDVKVRRHLETAGVQIRLTLPWSSSTPAPLPLTQAMFEARQQFASEPNPTWLLYTLYGDRALAGRVDALPGAVSASVPAVAAVELNGRTEQCAGGRGVVGDQLLKALVANEVSEPWASFSQRRAVRRLVATGRQAGQDGRLLGGRAGGKGRLPGQRDQQDDDEHDERSLGPQAILLVAPGGRVGVVMLEGEYHGGL